MYSMNCGINLSGRNSWSDNLTNIPFRVIYSVPLHRKESKCP
nr:MAG TPA_asm: hypothetical protein [Caudoviricetes sp.]